MSKYANTVNNRDTGYLSLLSLLFIGLKLSDHIDWSWWWVLSPIWIPAALVVIAILVVLIKK